MRRRREDEDVVCHGMGDEFWAKQKAVSEARMAIIDAAPREWRDLVNEFDPDAVAELAGRGLGVNQAREMLQRWMDRRRNNV